VGEIKNKANSAQLKLELGLSLAKTCVFKEMLGNCKGNVKKVRNTRKCQKMLENA
jgi:hypothetical protein